MKITRRKSKKIKIGNIFIGGNAPICVQSMPTIKTSRIAAVLKQIKNLETAGCELIRVSILDSKDTFAIKIIKKAIKIPLCADIHFNYRLALAAIKSGADKIRINPGNMYKREHVKNITCAAREKNIPLRIGVNVGSIDSSIRGKTTGEKLAKAAMKSLNYIESLKFHNIVLSAKGHSVNDTIEAYKILARKTVYPLHIGLTASGGGKYAIIKSSVGLGSLLSQGIGDTIRVSLTGDSVQEVNVAYEILQSLNLRRRNWEVIACPTCGRADIDVAGLSQRVETLLRQKKVRLPKFPFTIAVMGCVVNGPGESKQADIGITGGRGFGFIFKNGKMICKVKENKLLSTLLREIQKK